eukprot:TRINITY_DN1261_c0_g1_i1.p2 TRINITY_DN1261_c0_g1~~TRINITY_DN1261_c0_g1_i1.p2  ORF type:complete len:202 (+),score=65.83 TRINITY_DN1261_c0_g1_i1:65-607(+)
MAPTPVMTVCAALLESVAARGGDVSGKGDTVLYDAARAPRVGLADYLARWAEYAEVGDAEIICAVVYIDRVCTRAGVKISTRNVHRVLLGALLAATKWREERPFTMSYYAKVGGVDAQELRRLETRFINDIDWQLHVESPTVERYMEKFRRHPKWGAAAPRSDRAKMYEVQQAAAVPIRG